MPVVVIATPHDRNDRLENRVREGLSGYRVVRVRTPEELSLESLAEHGPEFVFFPHWSWLVREEIHSRFQCVIFHMTDVPYGRGGSPLQNLIVHGHEETMLSALQCIEELDAGPVYLKRRLPLSGTAEDILRRASALMEEMILEIVEHKPEPVPQEGDVVEFKRRQPKDGDLKQANDLRKAYDFIRMLDADGYPPAFLETDRLRIEFGDARLDDDFVEARVRIMRRTDD